MNDLLGALITGHFVRILCDSRGEGLIARLETESMPAVESGCLELWHHADGFSSGREYILGIDFIFNNVQCIQISIRRSRQTYLPILSSLFIA